MNIVYRYMKRNHVLVTNIGEDTRYFLGCSLKPNQSIVLNSGTVKTLLGMVDYPWLEVSSDFSEHTDIISRVVRSDGHDNNKRHGKYKEGVGYYYEVNRTSSV